MLVLDASAAIRVGMSTAKAALVEAVRDANEVVVPSLFDFEVTNVAWKYGALSDWPSEDCLTLVEDVLAIPDRRVNGAELSAEVLSLGLRKKQATYDLFYVVLARRNTAALATADAKLRKLCKSLGVNAIGA
ncbi:MAG: type II toxin-antitoxin system VapC family toxin [Myxococcota bacterium]